MKIYTLGRFDIRINDQPLRFSSKVPRRVLALLKAITDVGGDGVREDRIIDALWPEADGDAARFALTSALHRLRRLLGRPDALVRQGGEIRLNPRCCWVDVCAIGHFLTRMNASHRHSRAAGGAQFVAAARRAAELFDGPGPREEARADAKAGLRRRLVRAFVEVGDQHQREHQWEAAVDCYEIALRLDPNTEVATRRLSAAASALGD